MSEQGGANENVINFSCDHCRISLTVDESLAGITGPCPSCGNDITAPHPNAPRKVEMRPRDIRSRRGPSVDSTGGDVQISSRDAGLESSRRSRTRRRSISPETGVSEAHRERAEVAAVAKMLIAGLVVLAIVLAVAYWLNNRFNV